MREEHQERLEGVRAANTHGGMSEQVVVKHSDFPLR